MGERVKGDDKATARMPTGIAGLDAVTGGGLLPARIYLVVGRPGAGKSILASQIAFTHAKRKGRAVYATLLAETHSRLLGQAASLAFYEAAVVGRELVYLNGMGALESEGLAGLLRAVQAMVRKQEAELLVLDGLLSPAQLGVSSLEYKKFIAALQTWVEMQGCTVLILTTGAVSDPPGAEHTMVDGIIELGRRVTRMRTLREITIGKLRGSGFVEGAHSYVISERGVEVFPRIEAWHVVDAERSQPMDDRVPSGIVGLDALFDRGLVRGSTTLLLGSSGSGKTIAGLQFLVAGMAAGEPALHFGFFEPPDALLGKGERLGLDLEKHRRSGLFHVSWRPSAEPLLDQQAHDLLVQVERHGIRRVVIDGFAGLRTADHPERVSAAFVAVTNELTRRGVTVIVTDETREVFIRDVEIPTQNVSGLAHNIVLVRQVEIGAELLRLLSVMKTRDSGHDRRLWEFEITDGGLALSRPFNPAERGLMVGGLGGPPSPASR